MDQPKPNHAATHSLDAKGKPAPRNAREAMPPGGPIKPNPMGFENPGPTPDLRGVEPNTQPSRGTPNPHQQGTAGHHGAHSGDLSGTSGDPHGHGIPTPVVGNKGSKKHHGAPLVMPTPGDKVPKGARP